MAGLTWIFLFFIAAIILSFTRASLIVWTLSFILFLVAVTVSHAFSIAFLIAVWMIFIMLTPLFNVYPLRRALISKKLLSVYKKAMPSMSATEREALTAGSVGWEGEIFSGMPNWQALRAITAGKLSQEEQSFLEGPVNELCSMISNWEINHRKFDIPPEIWAFLKENGFFGLIIPKKYGGKEFSALAHSQIVTKISSVSIAVSTVVSVPNSLGPAELLMHYGTETQRNYYLPRLAQGKEIPCFALTSEVAGSDASSIVDTGIVCRSQQDGVEQLMIRLNWSKRYITLAPVATLIGLAFKLYDPDHLLGNQEYLGITCALIPADTLGAVTGRRHFPLCCAFPNGPTVGKDVLISVDNIIGGIKMAGSGWRMLMESLAGGRSISLPSLVSGGAKRIFFSTGAYARIRQQFHTYIGNFGGIKEALAQIGGLTYLTESVRLFTVTAVDRGLKPAVASAISKYHTTELCRHIMGHSMDVHGGKGIIMGPHNYVAQSHIEYPISITVEGANILTRSMIIFGQGALRCHPYLLREMIAANEKRDLKKALHDFDKALFSHIGFLFSNMTRSTLLAFSRGFFAHSPKSDLAYYYRQFSRFSASFAFMTDIAVLTLGANLKRMEQLSARLGDILSYLYMGSAALKYYELQSQREFLPIVRWACDELLYRIQTQLNELLHNLPHRRVACLCRFIVFPLGRHFKRPTDNLSNEVAELLLHPNNVRDRLCHHLYTDDTPHNPIGKLDTFLKKIIAVEPLERKLSQIIREKKITGKNVAEFIQKALDSNDLNPTEAQQLIDADEARQHVIRVDDFPYEDLLPKYHEENI